jgi:hypothetical protein
MSQIQGHGTSISQVPLPKHVIALTKARHLLQQCLPGDSGVWQLHRGGVELKHVIETNKAGAELKHVTALTKAGDSKSYWEIQRYGNCKLVHSRRRVAVLKQSMR